MRTCHSLAGRFAKEDHHEGPGNQSQKQNQVPAQETSGHWYFFHFMNIH